MYNVTILVQVSTSRDHHVAQLFGGSHQTALTQASILPCCYCTSLYSEIYDRIPLLAYIFY
jgi:hypothetical protein